jgi:hypothetical protein
MSIHDHWRWRMDNGSVNENLRAIQDETNGSLGLS